jgi:FkbM family methyltransferase
MPEIFDLIDRSIRRNAALPKLSWLRSLLRAPYHRLMGITTKGLPLSIGGVMNVRLPVQFCARELEGYELETSRAIHAWAVKNPGGLFVDIGCSYGYFSCGILFTDPTAQVLGIDADLPSLAITRHVCSLAPTVNERLELYRTLIGSDSTGDETASSLKARTTEQLNDPEMKIDPQSTSYVNLDTKIDETQLSRISLDQFLGERLAQQSRPCLIKCDVEGAEQIVLEGARQILSKFKPMILVSVHPPYLPKFGGSVDAIRKLLDDHGYQIDIIGIDHEEHWLCVARSA